MEWNKLLLCLFLDCRTFAFPDWTSCQCMASQTGDGVMLSCVGVQACSWLRSTDLRNLQWPPPSFLFFHLCFPHVYFAYVERGLYLRLVYSLA